MNTKKQKSLGFTLIELLVVIAIVGVLSGVVLQSIESARIKSRNTRRLSDIDQIDKALQLSLTKSNAQLPTSGSAWQCVGVTSPATCWTAGLAAATSLNSAITGNISEIPKDPYITTGDGAYYLYGFVTAASAFAYNGAGAYLRWLASDSTGSRICGRGSEFALAGPYQQCALFLGKD